MDKYIIQNLDFYYHFDERFKTVNLCIFFNMPLNEKYIPELVIIKNLIQKTSKLYKTESEQEYFSKSIYSTNFSATITRKAKVLFFDVTVSFINPKYITENIDIVKEAVRYLFNNLLNTDFTEEKLELEKQLLRQAHLNLYNNKNKYAGVQFTNHMFEGETESINLNGTLESVDKVTLASINEAYQYIINSPCYFFATGNLDCNIVINELNQHDLSAFKPFELNDDFIFIEDYNKEIETANEIIEEQDINQTILYMGFRSNIRINSKYRFAFNCYSLMLGGYFHSTLFQVIREKHNLAYSIGTSSKIDKGAIAVYAKISKDNIGLVKRLVLEEIEKYQDGLIDDKTFELTKKAYINRILQNSDSPFNSLYDLNEELTLKIKINDDIIIDAWKNITKEDIQEVANMFKLDTIYVLKGKA